MNPVPAPTLAAVAKHAGVSMITASRVVRLPDLVAPATRAKVEAAMRDLGYVPNLVAGSLASARTRSVGVLVPTIENSIFADTVQGVSDTLEPLGYAVILAQSRYDPMREERSLMALLARRPEALVMVGSPATLAGATLLRRAGIPIVEMWDLPDDAIDAVAGFDNHAAGLTVARHFASQGRRVLVYVGGDDPRARRRWSGFHDGALAAGLAPPRRIVLPRGGTGTETIRHEDLAGADAVFAANDAHAIGAMATLRRAGVAVPRDTAVIGLGDIRMGLLFDPRLTTIRIDGTAIGRAAAELTLNREGERRVDVGFELVIRESG